MNTSLRRTFARRLDISHSVHLSRLTNGLAKSFQLKSELVVLLLVLWITFYGTFKLASPPMPHPLFANLSPLRLPNAPYTNGTNDTMGNGQRDRWLPLICLLRQTATDLTNWIDGLMRLTHRDYTCFARMPARIKQHPSTCSLLGDQLSHSPYALIIKN